MKHLSNQSAGVISKNAAMIFAFALLSLFAFKAKAGGDLYEIYLNSKLILKQFATQPLNIKTLQLDRASADDKLVFFYSHCGKTGKDRRIAIKDDKGKILKEWKFADATAGSESMVIPVKEILQLATNKSDGHVVIYYSAQELPRGRMLASLDFRNRSVAFHSRAVRQSLNYKDWIVQLLLNRWTFSIKGI